MARKSAIGDANEAFELFLDTITNTFGGIVFISLLVCILLQIRGASGKTDMEADAARARAIEIDLIAVKAEITRLEELDRRVHGQVASADQQTDPRLVAEYERLNAEMQKYKAEQARLETAEQLRKQKATDLHVQLVSLKSERDRLQQQVMELESKLKDAQDRGSHKIRLPRYRATVKQQIPLAVFNQRMYFTYKYDGQGNATSRNESDFTVRPGLSGDTILTPKPGLGIKITNNSDFQQQLREQFAQFDKDTSYIHFAVWPDSYRECEIVRDILIDMGFGYGLLLLDSDGQLVLSSSGQRGEM